MESIYNTKLQDSFDNAIDPQLIHDISSKLYKPITETEEMLINLSLSSRLLPDQVRDAIGDDISLSDIDKLVTDSTFIDSVQAHEKQFSAHFAESSARVRRQKDILLKPTCVWWSASPRNTSGGACLFLTSFRREISG